MKKKQESKYVIKNPRAWCRSVSSDEDPRPVLVSCTTFSSWICLSLDELQKAAQQAHVQGGNPMWLRSPLLGWKHLG